MTHLRKMMLEELERRNYSEGTTRRYLLFVVLALRGEADRLIFLQSGCCHPIKPRPPPPLEPQLASANTTLHALR